MKPNCVRADNDDEYRYPFEYYFKEHGIKLEKIFFIEFELRRSTRERQVS